MLGENLRKLLYSLGFFSYRFIIEEAKEYFSRLIEHYEIRCKCLLFSNSTIVSNKISALAHNKKAANVHINISLPV